MRTPPTHNAHRTNGEPRRYQPPHPQTACPPHNWRCTPIGKACPMFRALDPQHAGRALCRFQITPQTADTIQTLSRVRARAQQSHMLANKHVGNQVDTNMCMHAHVNGNPCMHAHVHATADQSCQESTMQSCNICKSLGARTWMCRQIRT